MGDLVLLNFKVPPESAYSIQREMGFHDLNRSEFVPVHPYRRAAAARGAGVVGS